MAKGKILQDTFEQLAELGVSTAKKGAQQTVQTFSPLNILENLTTAHTEKPKTDTDKKTEGHTPIDISGLTKNYEKQDKEKENNLRNRLFNLVKAGEDQEMQKKKSEERERSVQEQREEQQKAEEEKKKRDAQIFGEIPQGKQRKSIFSPKAKAQREHAEYKPASGKS